MVAEFIQDIVVSYALSALFIQASKTLNQRGSKPRLKTWIALDELATRQEKRSLVLLARCVLLDECFPFLRTRVMERQGRNRRKSSSISHFLSSFPRA